MTQEQHPITPPPELVQQWIKEASNLWYTVTQSCEYIATQAARWGADMELEACRAGIHMLYGECGADWLRVRRRPKPPSLKERGRKALQSIHNAVVMETGGRELDVLKKIVESLPD